MIDFRPLRNAFLDIGLLLSIAITAPILVMRAQMRPADPLAAVAVIFPPWTSESAAVERAAGSGAALLGVGAAGFIVVVKPTDAAYVDRILDEGALLVLDPLVLLFCAPAANPEPKSL